MASWTLANWLPFDSFAIAWDRRQAFYLVLMYLALSAPFFFDALAVGWLLAARANDAPRIYAANLAGSAVGCFLALGALSGWGGEGAAVFCAWLAALASLAPMAARKFTRTWRCAGCSLLGCVRDPQPVAVGAPGLVHDSPLSLQGITPIAALPRRPAGVDALECVFAC